MRSQDKDQVEVLLFDHLVENISGMAVVSLLGVVEARGIQEPKFENNGLMVELSRVGDSHKNLFLTRMEDVMVVILIFIIGRKIIKVNDFPESL